MISFLITLQVTTFKVKKDWHSPIRNFYSDTAFIRNQI